MAAAGLGHLCLGHRGCIRDQNGSKAGVNEFQVSLVLNKFWLVWLFSIGSFSLGCFFGLGFSELH